MARASYFSRRRFWRGITKLALCVLVFSPLKMTLAQVPSIWQLDTGSTDWFALQNWDGLVPNAAGDYARIPASSSSVSRADLTAMVALGRLSVIGESDTTIGGIGPLVFDNPGNDPALFEVLRSDIPLIRAAVTAPVWIVPGEQLLLDLDKSTFLNLTGGISSADGDIIKTGIGQLNLPTGSPDWNGNITVERGTLVVEDENGLGSILGSTTIGGGTVEISHETYEPFVLESGVLATDVDHLRLYGHLTVLEGNQASLSGSFSIRGGSSGEGDLTLMPFHNAWAYVSENALSHTGDFTIVSNDSERGHMQISVDNTYKGLTTLRNMEVVVHATNGLGTADVGTNVVNGELQLPATSQEDIWLTNSSLLLSTYNNNSSLNHFAGNITLSSGTLGTADSFADPDHFSIAQPLVLDGGTNSITTKHAGLRIEGGIIGEGDLFIDADRRHSVIFVSNIDHIGKLEVSGPVTFLQPNAYSGTLFDRGGTITAETPQTFERFAAAEPCCDGGGAIIASPGSSITVGSIEYEARLLQGDVRTEGPIRYYQLYSGRTISNLTSDLDIEVFGGRLIIDDAEGIPTNGSVSLMRPSETMIELAPGSVTDADLYLNNSTGFANGGALRTSQQSGGLISTIRGDIYLGEQGAAIGSEYRIQADGDILGGDLTVIGSLELTGGELAYTGKTSVRKYSNLTLSEGVRLANTSDIEVFSTGRLFVDVGLNDPQESDRIPDDVQVTMHGGELSVWPNELRVDATERIGKITLERGRSYLSGVKLYGSRWEGDIETTGKLLVGDLERKPGSVLIASRTYTRSTSEFFRESSGGDFGGLVFENPPPVVNGILPAWLMSHPTSFATYSDEGVGLSDWLVQSTFAVADATSNVRPDGEDSAAGLTHDMTIHSLNMFGNVDPVDLNGHTLTVGSGGLIAPELSNGVIVPGEYAGGELIISSEFNLSADITDTDVPTSVIYAGDGKISGNNTYTGTTYVVGDEGDDVTVTGGAAIPIGGDIEISGHVELRIRASYTYQLGAISVRDGGSFDIRCKNCFVSADSILLESGIVSGGLNGNFPITKTTSGLGALYGARPEFTGDIDVYDGTLQVGDPGRNIGYLALGQGDVTVHPGGRLVLASKNDVIAETQPVDVHLSGGAIYGIDILKDYEISLYGDLVVEEDSKIYLLNGLEKDRWHGADIKMIGQTVIKAGNSLSVIGRSSSARGFVVTEGFDLEPNAVLGGTGSIRAHVDIYNGAIISPGLINEQPTVGTLGLSRPYSASEYHETEMTWGEGGRYRWEINDTAGFAGAPFGKGWDLLQIGGDFYDDGSEQNPFVIEVLSLDHEGSDGPLAGWTSSSEHRWLIAEVNKFATIHDFDPAHFEIDASQFRQFNDGVDDGSFWLEQDGNSIYLNASTESAPHFLTLAGGGTSYTQDFDVALSSDGSSTGTKLPNGWLARVDNLVRSRTTQEFPVGNATIEQGVYNAGGLPDSFVGGIPEGQPTYWFDAEDNGSGLEQDGAADRALVIGVGESADANELSLTARINQNDARAWRLQFDVEAWGADTNAAAIGEAAFNVTMEIDAGQGFMPSADFGIVTSGATLVGPDSTVGSGAINGNATANRTQFDSGVQEIFVPRDARLRVRWQVPENPASDGWLFGLDNVQLRTLAPGDANANGVVDVDDLLTLLGGQKFNQGVDGVTWAEGDFNADDQFNTGDLLAMLSFLSGTFPSDPYASEAGGASDAVADVIVNSETGEVTVDLAGHTVSAIIIESASEIFNGVQPEWDTTSQFPSALPGELGNVLFTSTASGVDELGAVISSEFLGRDKEFYLQDLDLNILIASEGGGLVKGNVLVVPEPSTWLLFGIGSLVLMANLRRRVAG